MKIFETKNTTNMISLQENLISKNPKEENTSANHYTNLYELSEKEFLQWANNPFIAKIQIFQDCQKSKSSDPFQKEDKSKENPKSKDSSSKFKLKPKEQNRRRRLNFRKNFISVHFKNELLDVLKNKPKVFECVFPGCEKTYCTFYKWQTHYRIHVKVILLVIFFLLF